MPSVSTELTYERKVQKRSRCGCGNCKLRKVKCDQSRPRCKKCVSFGVLCNYDARQSALQISANGDFKMKVMDFSPTSKKPFYEPPRVSDVTLSSLRNSICIPSPTLLTPSLSLSTASYETSGAYRLTDADIELMRIFHSRTVFTISTEKNRHLYQIEMIRLAFSHQQLMHATLSLTLMHNRALQGLTTPLTTQEATHWYLATSLFTARLSSSPSSSERDPLWATALFLGLISIFYIDASDPSQAWPLAPPNPTDLSWLQLTDGKNAVWKALGPPDGKDVLSALYIASPNRPVPTIPTKAAAFSTLPSPLLTLLDLSPTDEHNLNNPYLKPATLLSQAISATSIIPIIVGFFSFISSMSPSFKTLLSQKDPGALLLLLYWYTQMLKFPNWWIERRARLEGSAICIYLERCHGDAVMERLLESPRKFLGI